MTPPSSVLVQRATNQAIALIVGIVLILQWNNSAPPSATSSVASYPSNEPEYDTISLAVVGDLMCHSQQFEKSRTANGFDFRPVFEPVKKYLSGADLTFGNLETVTAGSEATFTGYPRFNTPVEYLDALKDCGFDVLTTANNHCLDRNFPGVVRTIEELDKREFLHTGTAKSATDRNTPLIINCRSFKLGALAYTFSTNGIPIPAGQEFCVNMIDTAQIKKDITATKNAGADLVAVFMHWGDEYQRIPNARQKQLAYFLHEQGAMLILGSHPHVLQPTQLMAWADEATFAIYSMGNFVSGQRKQFTDCGVIVRIQLIKNRNTGEIKYGKLDYVPTYVSTARGYRVLPVAEAIEAIRQGDKSSPAYTPDLGEQARLMAVWKETTKHLDDTQLVFMAAEAN